MNRAPYLIAMIVAASLAGCCNNEVEQTISSPSGASKAFVFNRDCGATVAFNTQVSITSGATDVPRGVGNALVLNGQVPLQLRWVSDRKLAISGLGSARVAVKNASVGEVTITYSP